MPGRRLPPPTRLWGAGPWRLWGGDHGRGRTARGETKTAPPLPGSHRRLAALPGPSYLHPEYSYRPTVTRGRRRGLVPDLLEEPPAETRAHDPAVILRGDRESCPHVVCGHKPLLVTDLPRYAPRRRYPVGACPLQPFQCFVT